MSLASGESSDGGAGTVGMISKLLPLISGGGDNAGLENIDLSALTGGSTGGTGDGSPDMNTLLDSINSLSNGSTSSNSSASSASSSSSNSLGLSDDLMSQLNQLTGNSGSTSKSKSAGNAKILSRSSPTRKREAPKVEMKSIDSAEMDTQLESSIRTSAVALHANGKLVEAIAAYQKAIRSNPNDASLYLNYAIAQYQTTDYTGAWQSVHKAASLGKTAPKKFRKALAKKMAEPQK